MVHKKASNNLQKNKTFLEIGIRFWNVRFLYCEVFKGFPWVIGIGRAKWKRCLWCYLKLMLLKNIHHIVCMNWLKWTEFWIIWDWPIYSNLNIMFSLPRAKFVKHKVGGLICNALLPACFQFSSRKSDIQSDAFDKIHHLCGSKHINKHKLLSWRTEVASVILQFDRFCTLMVFV